MLIIHLIVSYTIDHFLIVLWCWLSYNTILRSIIQNFKKGIQFFNVDVMNLSNAKNHLVQLFKLEMKKSVKYLSTIIYTAFAEEVNIIGEKLIKPGRICFAKCLLDEKNSKRNHGPVLPSDIATHQIKIQLQT